MNDFQTTERSISRPLAFLTLLSLLLARTAGAERVLLDVSGSVLGVGCPTPISCPSFPLMWGISGGESMTLRMVYDSEAPLVEDLSDPDAFFRIYEHALPLAPPLGVEVAFGPYSANVGSAGAAPEKYEISVFDAIDLLAFPEVGEDIGLAITVPPQTLNLPGPAGSHDLDLRGVQLDFRNVHDLFLNGAEIPAGFPGFDWEDTLLVVNVHDPVYDRDGTALLKIESLALSTLSSRSVPGLGPAGTFLLAIALLAVAAWSLGGIRTETADR